MILYVNSCVRAQSRTDKISRALLSKLGGEYEEVFLPDLNLEPLSEEMIDKRTELLESGCFDDPMFDLANQFAKADTIVISAPFWDASFPASLKLYEEHIYCVGLTSKYDETGMPVGLCNAKELYFVTTAGGPLIEDFGFGYWKMLATVCFGIKDVKLVKAEMLDVIGFDADKIVNDVIEAL